LGLRAWRPTSMQFLSANDKQVRVTSCKDILISFPSVRKRKRVFFTDECAVYGSGRRQNIVFWAKDNPHFIDQITHYPPKVMFWCAISATHLISPIVCDGAITSESYINMLRHDFLPQLRNTNIRNPVFQQDGAPGHTAYATRDFLNEEFPNKWIGKFGPVNWPPRSPDLTTPDNALWGYLKSGITS
jgi:hypothetical protein